MPNVPIEKNTQLDPVTTRPVRDFGVQMSAGASPYMPDKGAGDIAGAVQDYAKAATDRANQVAVIDAQRQLSNWEATNLFDPQNGAYTKKGQDALAMPEVLNKSYQQTAQQLIGTAANDDQRMAIQKLVDSRQESWNQPFQGYVRQQLDDVAKGTAQAGVDAEQNRAALYSNIPQVRDQALQNAQDTYEAFQIKQGASPEQIADGKFDVGSQGHLTVLKRMADVDLGGAVTYYNANQSGMNAQNLVEAQNLMNPVITKQVALSSFNNLSKYGGVATTPNEQIFSKMTGAESSGQQIGGPGSVAGPDQPTTSTKGAIGISQMLPSTGPEAAQAAGMPWDPVKFANDADYNKALGQAYFNKQVNDFGNKPLAIMAYNAGPQAVTDAIAKNGDPRTGAINMDDFINKFPYAETKGYVAKVLGATSSLPQAGQLYAQAGALETQHAGAGQELIKIYSEALDAETKQHEANKQAALDAALPIVQANNGDWTKVPPAIRAQATAAGVWDDITKYTGSSDPNIKTDLMTMSPDALIKTDLSKFRTQLSPEDYQKAVDKQQSLSKDTNAKALAQTRDQMVNGSFGGMTNYNKPQIANFNELLDAQVENYKKQHNGTAPDTPNLQKMIDGLHIAVPSTSSSFSLNPLNYFSSGGGGQMPYDYTIDQVPASDQDKIRTTLQNLGVVPTNGQIINYYLSNQAKNGG